MEMIPPIEEDVVILPLAITQVDENHGCAAGITQDARWFRPEPIPLDHVAGDHPQYHFGSGFRSRLGPSQCDDCRPEDRTLIMRLPMVEEVPEWREEALEAWLAAHLDRSVQSVFAGERSIGLIRAQLETVEVIRSTRGRFLVRLGFTDEDEQLYQWITPDLPFGRLMISIFHNAEDFGEIARQVIDCMRETTVFLTVALSKPKPNALGSIRGCQPLVGGVHSFPPYKNFLPDRFLKAHEALD
jgi:hypothetical protein